MEGVRMNRNDDTSPPKSSMPAYDDQGDLTNLDDQEMDEREQLGLNQQEDDEYM